MEPSDKLKQALDRVKANGCNIYMLLNRLKNQINASRIKKGYPKADIEFPEQALFNVCASYHRYKPKLAWPWLCKVIKIESDKYLQNEEVKKHEKQRKIKPVMSLGEILNKAQSEARLSS